MGTKQRKSVRSVNLDKNENICVGLLTYGIKICGTFNLWDQNLWDFYLASSTNDCMLLFNFGCLYAAVLVTHVWLSLLVVDFFPGEQVLHCLHVILRDGVKQRILENTGSVIGGIAKRISVHIIVDVRPTLNSFRAWDSFMIDKNNAYSCTKMQFHRISN